MDKRNNSKFYIEQGYYKWTLKSFEQDRVTKLLKELDNVLSNKNNLNVLDVGSGSGELIYKLSLKYPLNNYYGNDIANNIISKNKKNKKTVKWTVEDFNNKISYKNNFFDVIIAGEIVEHLYDTDGFFLEVKRVLRKKGRLYITTPNLASWLDRLTLLLGMQPFSTEVSNKSRKFGRESFYKILGLDGESDSAGHLRCFTKGSMRSILSFYKFRIVKDVPCHVHNFLLNRIMTRVFKELSENLFFIAQK
jgi:2-polyprenyl-3-methyl-5-hydroxy-6-metoxy-1,4-benzoquinol methylase